MFSPTTRRQTIGELEKVGTLSKDGKQIDCYRAKELGKRYFFPTSHATVAVFLKRASKLLDDKEMAEVAQAHVDGMLGANLHDASHVNGVGQNQISHRPYAQFFPPVPHIPGAVNIGIEGIGHDVYSEYDMPCVGMFMYLLSEYL